jgi:hypothetical protein
VKRVRGLKDLLEDGIEYGASRLEQLQKETAAVPFGVLEALPVVGPAAQVVHELHDATLSAVYGMVRGTTKLVGSGVDVVLQLLQE